MTDQSAPTGPASHGTAEPASSGQPAVDAAPAAGTPAASVPASPYDDLLCTICGLKACWQAPANAKGSATGR